MLAETEACVDLISEECSVACSASDGCSDWVPSCAMTTPVANGSCACSSTTVVSVMERGLVARVFVVDKEKTVAVTVKRNTTASVPAAIVVFCASYVASMVISSFEELK
jgi:hypothetical protein